MSDRAEQDDWIARASAAFAFYGAMLGGTLGGQAAGIAVDAILGTRSLWIPLACSVVLEGVLGGRASPRVLAPREAARVSIRYSLALLVGSAVLVAWIVASHPWAGARLGWSARAVAVGVAMVAAGTALRAALLSTLSRRRR